MTLTTAEGFNAIQTWRSVRQSYSHLQFSCAYLIRLGDARHFHSIISKLFAPAAGS